MNVRGHVFNSGKFAANAGIGLRYLCSRIWGINAYYDYRETRHHRYHQISGGLESLGEIWDFRINGYFPLGDTKNSLNGGKAIGGFEFEGSGRIIIDENIFSQTTAIVLGFNAGVVRIFIRAGGDINLQVNGNTWVDSQDPASPSLGVITDDLTSTVCLTLKGNQSDITPTAYRLDNTAGGSFTADVSNNIGPVTEQGVITPGTCP